MKATSRAGIGKGWHKQSLRHSNARKLGTAGGKYATFERCVKKVKGQEGYNPYAVCRKSTGYKGKTNPKTMTYKELKQTGHRITPNADTDGDGVPNSKDCRPMNKQAQDNGLPKQLTKPETPETDKQFFKRMDERKEYYTSQENKKTGFFTKAKQKIEEYNKKREEQKEAERAEKIKKDQETLEKLRTERLKAEEEHKTKLAILKTKADKLAEEERIKHEIATEKDKIDELSGAKEKRLRREKFLREAGTSLKKGATILGKALKEEARFAIMGKTRKKTHSKTKGKGKRKKRPKETPLFQ